MLRIYDCMTDTIITFLHIYIGTWLRKYDILGSRKHSNPVTLIGKELVCALFAQFNVVTSLGPGFLRLHKAFISNIDN